MSIKVVIGALALGAAVATATAQAATLTGIATLTGTCEKLVLPDVDMSKDCKGKIIQSIYDTGRTGFTVFVGPHDVAVTMSGLEGPKPDQDTQLQSVDMLIFNLNIEGVDPSTEKLQGSCAYANPYLGPMTISCQANDQKGGGYLMQFRTDGSEPQMADLRDPAAPSTSMSDGTFQTGRWYGRPLKDDPEKGCLVMQDIDTEWSVMLYANPNEAFELALLSMKRKFDPKAPPTARLKFDNIPYPVETTEVRTDQIIVLHSVGEEEAGFQGVVEAASRVEISSEDFTVRASLSGSRNAISGLMQCVAQTGGGGFDIEGDDECDGC